MSTIKLQLNAPVTGSFRYCDFADGQFGRQVSLNGDWDGAGKGRIYLNEDCINQIVGLGLVEPQPDAQGKFRVRGQPRVTILKTPGQGRSFVTTITPAGAPAYGAPPQNNYAPPPVGYAPPPQYTTPGPASYTPPAQPAPYAPSPYQPSPPMQQPVEHPAETCKRLEATIILSLESAKRAWAKVFPDATPYDAIAATAHTLFIERNKRGIPLTQIPQQAPPPPPLADDQQLREIDELAAAMGWTPQIGKQEMSAFLGGDPGALTVAQAQRVVAEFKRRVDERLAQARPPQVVTNASEIPFSWLLPLAVTFLGGFC